VSCSNKERISQSLDNKWRKQKKKPSCWCRCNLWFYMSRSYKWIWSRLSWSMPKRLISLEKSTTGKGWCGLRNLWSWLNNWQGKICRFLRSLRRKRRRKDFLADLNLFISQQKTGLIIIKMGIALGIACYICIVVLSLGYIVVKKWGDKANEVDKYN